MMREKLLHRYCCFTFYVFFPAFFTVHDDFFLVFSKKNKPTALQFWHYSSRFHSGRFGGLLFNPLTFLCFELYWNFKDSLYSRTLFQTAKLISLCLSIIDLLKVSFDLAFTGRCSPFWTLSRPLENHLCLFKNWNP